MQIEPTIKITNEQKVCLKKTINFFQKKNN